MCVASVLNVISRHRIKGGKDAQDAFSCTSLFAKEPLNMGLF